jgi:hypothetical protein
LRSVRYPQDPRPRRYRVAMDTGSSCSSIRAGRLPFPVRARAHWKKAGMIRCLSRWRIVRIRVPTLAGSMWSISPSSGVSDFFATVTGSFDTDGLWMRGLHMRGLSQDRLLAHLRTSILAFTKTFERRLCTADQPVDATKWKPRERGHLKQRPRIYCSESWKACGWISETRRTPCAKGAMGPPGSFY